MDRRLRALTVLGAALISTLALSGLVFVGFPAVPSAAAAAPTPRPLNVVLLGDSYSAGNGARNAAGDKDYYGPDPCHRSKANWASQYVAALDANGYNVAYQNRACSDGVTADMVSPRNMGTATRSITTPPGVSNDVAALAAVNAADPCNTHRYSDEEYWTYRLDYWNGLAITYDCTRFLRPQTDFVGSQTDLVLFTMGGNDIKFSNIVKQCFLAGDRSPGDCRDAVNEARSRLGDVQTGVLAAIDQMRANGLRNDAHIVYLGYPLLAQNNGYDLTSWFGLGRDHYAVADEVRQLGRDGDAEQREIVSAANVGHPGQVIHLDGVPATFEGHEPDGSATHRNPDRWLNEFLESTAQREFYHPNSLGQAAYASLLARGGDYGAGRPVTAGGDLDIVFAVDTTGSMGDDIDAAKQTARDLVDDVQAHTSSARFAVVDYKDQPDWSGDPYASQVDQGFTSSAELIRSALDGLSAAGGGDTPEAMYSGIEAGLGLPWRAGVKKVVVVLADAPPHDPEPVTGLTADQVIADSYAVDPAAVYVADTGGATSGALQRVVDQTGGQTIPATGDVAQALDDAIDTAIQNPFAWINGPYTDQIGQPVTIDGSGSYPVRGSTVGYAWDFDGDGTIDETTTSPVVTHTWTTAYDGLIALTVTDSEGGSSVATTHVGITSDGDEIADETDNCPDVENQGQEDTDGDGVGDACDSTPGFSTTDQPGVYEGDLLVNPAIGPGTAVQSLAPLVAPRIRGRFQAGKVLRVDSGVWPESTSLSTQWLRDGAPIDGASGRVYTLRTKDVGHAVSALITASRAGVTGSMATSSSRVSKLRPRLHVQVARHTSTTVELRVTLRARHLHVHGRLKVMDGLQLVFDDRLRRPRATVVIRGLRPGRHVLRVLFRSNGGALSAVRTDQVVRLG